MRLKPNQALYVRSMGNALRVTAIFTSADEANEYTESHRDEGVVAQFGPYILLANLYDPGATVDDDPANARRVDELLAALVDLVEWDERQGGWNAPCWRRARAAIRKARPKGGAA
jgi:hypothetical protein